MSGDANLRKHLVLVGNVGVVDFRICFVARAESYVCASSRLPLASRVLWWATARAIAFPASFAFCVSRASVALIWHFIGRMPSPPSSHVRGRSVGYYCHVVPRKTTVGVFGATQLGVNQCAGAGVEGLGIVALNIGYHRDDGGMTAGEPPFLLE